MCIRDRAKGGFTDGVSIAGEAGTEAVISFDPSVRSANIANWHKQSTYGSMVKRLRHRPFTAVTGVQIPLESLTIIRLSMPKMCIRDRCWKVKGSGQETKPRT